MLEIYIHCISIHALHEECDCRGKSFRYGRTNFNPRTPWRVRQTEQQLKYHPLIFQSTHSMKSATLKLLAVAVILSFQSTHSMKSATGCYRNCQQIYWHFNPRTPWRVRPMMLSKVCDSLTFQSTHSMKSATLTGKSNSYLNIISIHALHEECDDRIICQPLITAYFNPRTPWRVRLNW